ncbi:relaxase/mobilization nuclease domain-containing protein [Kineococcus sp. SYSU DK006]|uniref:relaxase/mobilization nuclease domain-containing protein n=1 Tax=Kineococcus sp. SYSU DK006 TaxID=3383127 RepID=UPI003D7CC962
MPNIVRGERMQGLMVYLAGPGKANEHSEPHLVAGDAAIMAWHDDAELDRASALAIAEQLDAPRKVLGVEVAGGSVWHCSLSLKAEEGVQSDEKWAAIARDFVDGMGFSEASGKAPCRWVAVRHGLSKEGNDHIHLALSLVREDGTKADPFRDYFKAQRLTGELERKYGLQVLESRQLGIGERGLKPAELERAQRTGAEPERLRLARQVRAASAEASSEVDFVRTLRAAGVLVRPRYAAGRDDVVTGFSVALRPAEGEKPYWIGGGQLARDLTLPRLRQQWPDTPEAASAAVAEWRRSRRSQRLEHGTERGALRPVSPEQWVKHTEEVAQLREYLRTVPVDDHATWTQVARETAGVFAVWSQRAEPTPGPLAETSRALARFAQVRAHRAEPRPSAMPSVHGAVLALAVASDSGSSRMAQAVMLRQLANTMKAAHDAMSARGEARSAAAVASVARHQLRAIAAALPDPGDGQQRPAVLREVRATRERAAAQARTTGAQRAPGSPVPTRLQPGTAAAAQRAGSGARGGPGASQEGRGEHLER